MKKKDLKDLDGFEIPEINVKAVSRVNQILKAILRMAAILLIIVAIIEIVIVGVMTISNFTKVSEATNVDLISKMEKSYHEKFVVLSQDTDKKGNGSYILYPKSNQEIRCYAYKLNGNYQEDYLIRLLQYRINHMEDETLKSKFEIRFTEGIENKQFPNNQLLKCDISTKVSDYSELGKGIDTIYEFLNTVYTKKDNIVIKMGCGIQLQIGNSYHTYLYFNDWESMDQIKYIQKYYYINYHKEKNSTMPDVAQSEIETIWRPEVLAIYINGKRMDPPDGKYGGNNAKYDLEAREYRVGYLNQIAKQAESMELVEQTKSGNRSIRYKGVEYTLENTDEGKEALTYQSKISAMENILGIRVEYDYDKRMINLII